jgi:hypothetical protein
MAEVAVQVVVQDGMVPTMQELELPIRDMQVVRHILTVVLIEKVEQVAVQMPLALLRLEIIGLAQQAVQELQLQYQAHQLLMLAAVVEV